MGLLSNRITREDLQPGDHIYSWRTAYTYAHHGIYVGDGKVIHFTRGRGEEMGTGTVLDLLLLSSGPHATHKCPTCDHQQDKNGVICSCLSCFLAEGALYRFEYAVGPGLFLAKARGGTCTLAETDPPETVVHRARCFKMDLGAITFLRTIVKTSLFTARLVCSYLRESVLVEVVKQHQLLVLLLQFFHPLCDF